MIITENQDFAALNKYLAEKKPSKIFFICDENTHEKCLVRMLPEISTTIPFEIFEIEAGEEMKNIETAAHLWAALADCQADRKSLLVNVGGGVVTDLGGFVASTYKRGVEFVNMPTTLLAMCDASIGGKTGIDHAFYKNIVGTFVLPENIFLFPDFLETLPFEQLRSGFAEMLKHGLIADKRHWQDLIAIKSLGWQRIAPYISRSMEIKQSIVDQDFKEKNIRKTLNFGHTAGHAIESAFLENGEPIPHGEAVAAGMIIETKIAELEEILSKETAGKIISAISSYFSAINISAFNDDYLYKKMENDKKNDNGTINFSLIKSIGEGIYDCIAQKENVLSGLSFYRDLYNFN